MQRLEEAVLDRLRPGRSERFILPPGEVPGLRAALESAAAGPRGRAEVERAVQLVVALRTSLSSPTAGETLAELLRASPEARPHLQALGARRGYEAEARRFLRAEGRGAPLRAPSVAPSASPEPGGLQVKDFLSPGGGGSTQPGPRRRR